jgi:delta24-sterol reductase
MDQHLKTVQDISARLKTLYTSKQQFRIFHGSTNSTRSYTVDPQRMINTSSLVHVLLIDATTKTCLVEPNVSMEKLVQATLAFNLLPPVVMEFRGITVGGGFSGTGGESSSFKHGSFDKTVKGIEIVLADGSITKASPHENADLFYGATSSLGTLGVTTLLEVQLVDAERYVQVTYTPCSSLQHTLASIQTASVDDSNDYVDGFLTSLHRGIVVTGHLTSSLPQGQTPQHFTRAHDPWFYQHAEVMTKNGITVATDTIPILDYLFRYDRAAFWMGKYAFSYFKVPCNLLTRWLLDGFMQTSIMYHALHASNHMQKYVIQDVAIPAEHVEAFIVAVDAEFGIYPLWLCPMKPWKRETRVGDGETCSFHPHATEDAETKLLINVGIWGPNNCTSAQQTLLRNRALEKLVHDHKGRKWLYAEAFYPAAEFSNIYHDDQVAYQKLRQRYKADHLASVFDKACGSSNNKTAETTSRNVKRGWKVWATQTVWDIWPVSGVYGVWSTLASRQYLLGK